MRHPLFKLLTAIRYESEGVPERLLFFVKEAEKFGIDQVPEYVELIRAMRDAATIPLSDISKT